MIGAVKESADPCGRLSKALVCGYSLVGLRDRIPPGACTSVCCEC